MTGSERPASRPRGLFGRRVECGVLDGLLEQVRAGRSAVLVVRGEAGVGKTALLDYVVQEAADLRVARAVGVESEMELAFAALHQLCGPMLDRLDRLPEPQRAALGTAFGLEAGPSPDRFLVGLAVLSLLSEVAAERPFLCVVDDAQWLDRASAQALAFAARRLHAESVLMVFAAREPAPDFHGLPDLVVGGLREADARMLLASVVRSPLDRRVMERIVAETRGNPLALLELPRELSPAQLAGGFGLPEVLPAPDRIEDSFLRRIEQLPEPARMLLAVAAADPTGDAVLVRRAAGQLWLGAEAAGAAESAGLLEIGARVRFRHPLVRSAAGQAGLPEIARAARAAPAAPQPQAPDLLLDGLAILITDGYEAGTPVAQRAVSAFRGPGLAVEDAMRWSFVATHTAHDLWDDEGWEALSARHLQLARDVGALGLLPIAIAQRVGMHLHAGEFAAAAALVEETEAITEATGADLPPYSALALAAWQGHEDEATGLIRATLNRVTARGEGMGLSLTLYTSAVLHNGLGRYRDAFDAAKQASAYPQELGFANFALVELVEAAARSGEDAHAADAAERLTLTTGPSQTPWGRGVQARSRALVSEGDQAGHLYREAIDQLGRCRGVMALARAHLVYGEWLNRGGWPAEARTQLRTAHQIFAATGAEAFSERTRRVLAATGETVPRPAGEPRGELTAQEGQIARRARDGYSNSEIGAELFISPRTVEWHLRKVFTKLGISSRRELQAALPDRTGLARPA